MGKHSISEIHIDDLFLLFFHRLVGVNPDQSNTIIQSLFYSILTPYEIFLV